jgi:hypothetical protein
MRSLKPTKFLPCPQVTPGSNASVECAVAGDPEPTVTWYKDSIEIDGDMIEVRRNEHQLSQQSSSDLASVVAKTRVIVLLNDVTAHQTGDYR